MLKRSPAAGTLRATLQRRNSLSPIEKGERRRAADAKRAAAQEAVEVAAQEAAEWAATPVGTLMGLGYKPEFALHAVRVLGEQASTAELIQWIDRNCQKSSSAAPQNETLLKCRIMSIRNTHLLELAITLCKKRIPGVCCATLDIFSDSACGMDIVVKGVRQQTLAVLQKKPHWKRASIKQMRTLRRCEAKQSHCELVDRTALTRVHHVFCQRLLNGDIDKCYKLLTPKLQSDLPLAKFELVVRWLGVRKEGAYVHNQKVDETTCQAEVILHAGPLRAWKFVSEWDGVTRKLKRFRFLPWTADLGKQGIETAPMLPEIQRVKPHQHRLGSAMDLHDVWSIGHLTSLGVILLVHVLKTRGTIDGSERVVDLLGGKIVHPAYRDLSLDMLLNQSSGFAATTSTSRIMLQLVQCESSTESRYKFVQCLLQQPPTFHPGATCAYYSPSNLVAAAAVLECVTHRKFENMMREEIFKPLGFAPTCDFAQVQGPARFSSSDRALLVWGHGGSEEGFVDPVIMETEPHMSAALGLAMTMQDFGRLIAPYASATLAEEQLLITPAEHARLLESFSQCCQLVDGDKLFCQSQHAQITVGLCLDVGTGSARVIFANDASQNTALQVWNSLG